MIGSAVAGRRMGVEAIPTATTCDETDLCIDRFEEDVAVRRRVGGQANLIAQSTKEPTARRVRGDVELESRCKSEIRR
ncbi:hypothetical protein [Gemmatimonas sp.]|uniref:hypothetical protein n=1 Tax=Gemmatimonas sp. TaxID=1962908 RepID=UPI00286E2015|nr:hypothetical protein [Gemmatimonas sp.]